MFRIEQVNPILKVPFLDGPIRFLPNPICNVNELSGIDLGKFFSRVFHLKGIVKKVPRIMAGVASGALLGGGWGGAAAGAVSAAAFRRRAGTSLFQDIYRGGLYGMIGGAVVGAGKVALGKSQEAGLIGKGYEYIRKTFFGPKPTIQYKSPIGPVKPSIQGPCIVPGECPLPVQTNTGNLWKSSWELTKEVLPEALPVAAKFGEKTLDYMTAQQQAKAAQYAAAAAQVSQVEPGITSQLPGFNPFVVTPVSTPGGPIYGSGPSGVPSDIGGGAAFPIVPQEIPGEEEIVARPWYMNPLVLLGGGGVLLFVLTR